MRTEPDFVQQARRTVDLAEKLDLITSVTGWGMAEAWGLLRAGDLDAVEERIGSVELLTYEESVARHPSSRAKEDTKFVRWVAAQDWPEAYLDDEEDES